jgi:hypothetical protein
MNAGKKQFPSSMPVFLLKKDSLSGMGWIMMKNTGTSLKYMT